ncbi:MAG TPA: DNA-binding protein [Sedimenticola thiotaurini]|uniref:DNA-binding protein n=1 Tax=Sedimenticola thiotaurini TaxID=1543721 RepID=A0A831RNS9_9GAMM|nr:DNA-binding protein [Sedimenticola thiotaurini]
MTKPDLTVKEACAVLGIGRTKAYELMRQGVLRTYKLGPSRRDGVRIRRESVEKLRSRGAGV